ncbi:MAG: NAD(P)H-binding protein [Thermoplasmatota archaeon]|nr:NAD(P)H-binding protein [Halobacteriales archaeon]
MAPTRRRTRKTKSRPAKRAKPARRPASKARTKRSASKVPAPRRKPPARRTAVTRRSKTPPASGPAGPSRAAPQAGQARRPLRIALFGAGGMVGSRILAEAVARGHAVTAIQRHPFPARSPLVRPEAGDVTDAAAVARLLRGHHAAVSAVAPPAGDVRMLSEVARNLLAAARTTGVRRLVVVGGAGSLEVAPGLALVDTPAFPENWKWIGNAHREALAVYRAEGKGVDWTFVSPPAMLTPGSRSGAYRVGADQLLKDGKGASAISAEDYAVAVMDEVEHGRYKGRRMTVASA